MAIRPKTGSNPSGTSHNTGPARTARSRPATGPRPVAPTCRNSIRARSARARSRTSRGSPRGAERRRRSSTDRHPPPPVDEVDPDHLHRQVVLPNRALGDHPGVGSPLPVLLVAVLAGMAAQADLDRDALIRKRKAAARVGREAPGPRARAADEGGRRRPRPGPTGPRSTSPRHTGSTSVPWSAISARRCLPGRAAPALPAGRGPREGRDWFVRPRPVLRDVPRGLRAGLVRMAKDQDLPLNPLRISGACGRLHVLPEVRAPAVRQGAGVRPDTAPRSRRRRARAGWSSHNCPRESVEGSAPRPSSRCSCSFASVCEPPRAAHDEP